MRRRGQRPREEMELNIAPLIDMMFILLIFFVVTASFVREAGIEVERPRAATAEPRKVNVVLAITADDRVFFQGREVEPGALRGILERLKGETPELHVVIAADRRSSTGLVIEVLDQVRLAGIEDVSLSALREEG